MFQNEKADSGDDKTRRWKGLRSAVINTPLILALALRPQREALLWQRKLVHQDGWLQSVMAWEYFAGVNSFALSGIDASGFVSGMDGPVNMLPYSGQ